jgi:predicted porin
MARSVSPSTRGACARTDVGRFVSGVGIALSIVAGSAGAQGSITLYGIADTAVERSDADANRAFNGARTGAGGSTRLIGGQPGNAKGSRFGLRGAEDLGGGLRAIFAIEHRYDIDTGGQSNPAFWNGQAWVGLDGRWGRLTAGRQTTPLFWAMIAVDATSDQWYGTLVSSARYATRFDNSLEYRTPRWGGLQLFTMAATDENVSDARGQYAFGALWESQTLLVSGAWQRLDAAGANGSTVQYATGFAWKTGAHQFGAGWISNDPSGGGRRIDYPYVSLRIAIGPGNFYANILGSMFETERKDAMQYAIAYDWPLSRRTTAYVAGSIDTDLRFDDSAPPAAPVYRDGRRFAVGLRHNF